MPGSGKTPDAWSADAKSVVVIETAVLSEAELSEYCRSKALCSEQVRQWKADCLSGMQAHPQQVREQQAIRRKDKKRIKQLERDLNRKEKALAEVVALLVLRKKLNALWDDDEANSPHSQSSRLS
ncbi:MAG: hypothetical protein OXT49_08920 [Gammaproteobacteria bacterium]|nr:hypothetical protein [Gammaproteobacteria bacterium]